MKHLHPLWLILVTACSGSLGPTTGDSLPSGDGTGDAQSSGDPIGGDTGTGDMAMGDPTSGDPQSGDTGMAGDMDVVGSTLPPPSSAPVLSYCPFDAGGDLTTYMGRPVVRVCPAGDGRVGCDVDTFSAAIAAASSGDRIEIVGDGADYTQCMAIPDTLSNLEIVGVCGRPHIRDTVCQLKGAFVNQGSDITITDVEVSGLAISAGNGGNAAAVRDQGSGDLTLHYVHFHDNQNGILGGFGTVTIEWSKLEANGSAVDPGFTHNTYLAAEVEELIIRNSIILRAAYEGNNMKSRAQKMVFECSVSASLDGEDSREMDISEGGDVLIRNSIVEQGPPSVNSNIIGFATESNNPDRRHAIMQLVIRDTDIINDRGSGSFIAYNAFNSFSLELDNVRFVGAGTQMVNSNGGMETLTQNGVQTFADRAAAGMPAYSTQASQLPMPPGCPNFEYF